MQKQTVRDIDVAQKTVLLRVDYNVPIVDGEVRDDYRIKATLPTLEYLLKQKAKIVIATHLGRPNGEVSSEFSVKPLASKLSELLGKDVGFVEESVGEKAEVAAAKLKPGEVLLLENLRFYPGEVANDPQFAQQLSRLGEVLVQDAFGLVHRAHASMSAVTEYLPAVAGLLLEREVTVLTKALEKPKRPLVAIIGGAKISTKLAALRALLPKVDKLVVGGAMSNTFFLDKHYKIGIGRSLAEPDMKSEVVAIVKEYSDKLILPLKDVTVAPAATEDAPARVIDTQAVAAEDMILDFGPESTKEVLGVIRSAGTVIWSGPVGVAELTPFLRGSFYIAHVLARSQAQTIIGGGDTAALISQFGMLEDFSHVSTGGGAMLDFIAGKPLPGIAALADKPGK